MSTTVFVFPMLLACVVGFVSGIVIIIGAVSMMKLRSHGLATVASILALLPCSPIWLFGLAAGIWSLVVLSREDVKDAFRGTRANGGGGSKPEPFEQLKNQVSSPHSVHPMWITIFWFGWATIAVIGIVMGLSRHRIILPGLPAHPPLLLLLGFTAMSLVLLVIVQAAKKSDWHATALGQKPLLGITVATFIIACIVLLWVIPAANPLIIPRTPRDATALLTYKVADSRVEFTLNDRRLPVSEDGLVVLPLQPGEYEIASIKEGISLMTSGEVLHAGQQKFVEEMKADVIRVRGPLRLAFGPSSGGANTSDFITIQGRWEIVSQVRGGEPVSELQRGKWIKFDGAMMHSDVPKTPRYQAFFADSPFTMNPATDPPQFDVMVIGARGIYRLTQDTLQLAIADADCPRPTEFTSPPGSKITLTVCRRAHDPAETVTAEKGLDSTISPH